jgi:hypothetical protein
VRALPGPCVEVRCRLSLDVARERYATRERDGRHLDRGRTRGVGPLVEVDITKDVDVARLAADVGSP